MVIKKSARGKRRLARALPVIGWREWVSIPALGIDRIKAKIDTGARSSSLHVSEVKLTKRDGKDFARFKVRPMQRSSQGAVTCEVEILEFRLVRSSSGHTQERPVIVVPVQLLDQTWPIEVTLANRDEMGFRMLLGREAVRRRFLVDAGRSFYGERPKKQPND